MTRGVTLGYVTDLQVMGQWAKVDREINVPPKAEDFGLRGEIMAWDYRDPKRTLNRTLLYIDDVRLEIARDAR